MSDYQSKYTGVEIDNAVGKALNPSWNDLTDRPFYEETGLKRVCKLGTGENTTVQHTFSVGDKVTVTVTPILVDLGYLEWYGISADFKKTVEVVVTDDGGLLAMKYNESERDPTLGVSFRLAYKESILVASVDIYSEKENYWCPCGFVAVDVEVPIVKTIEPKYLPGVCLPVVELTTMIFDGEAQLTEEESQLMDKLVYKQSPFLLKFALNGDWWITFMLLQFSYLGNNVAFFHSLTYNSTSVWLNRSNEGVWTVNGSYGA